MTREFVRMPEFERKWQSIGLNENDLSELEQFLCAHPESGPVIQGTGGLRKLRWKLGDKGKSSSVRTIYIDFAYYEKIYLITAYTKDEKDNLTQSEKNEIKKLVKLLEFELERKGKR
jgi:hypothetical protein